MTAVIVIRLQLSSFRFKELGDRRDRYCSARDWDGSGLLGGIPRVLVQVSALTLKGPL